MTKERILTGVLLAALIGAIIAIDGVVYGFSFEGFTTLVGYSIGVYLPILLIAALSKGKLKKTPFTPGKLAIILVFLCASNFEKCLVSVDLIQAKPYLRAARSPDDFKRFSTEHPDNRILRFFAFAIPMHAEEVRNITALAYAVEPMDLPNFKDLPSMDLAKLDNYVDKLREAEDNARAYGVKAEQMNAAYREKTVEAAKPLGDDFSKNALIGFDHTAAV